MRRKLTKEIVSVLEGYRRISEIAGNAIFIHDIKGKIFEVDEIACQLTGYSRKELLKMNVRDLHPEAERKTSACKLKEISEKNPCVDFLSKFVKKSGEVMDVRITADRFKFKNEFFIIGFVRQLKPHEVDVARKKLNAKKKTGSYSKLVDRLAEEYIEAIQVLIDVAESRDPYTMKHSAKVTRYAVMLAENLKLSKKEKENIRIAAMFHDIGKIGIKTEVLMKPSSLDADEYEQVKQHPILSVEIIRPIKPLAELIPVIRHHHENFDGSGYPYGLKGKDIPLGARILAIADVYDALTSDRSYRKAYSSTAALKIMAEDSGVKFDPGILKEFVKCMEKNHNSNHKNKP